MTDAAPEPQYQGPQRVFSGMQPTNGLHLGNYLGTAKFVRLQDEYECIYCIVDLHAITTGPDPKIWRRAAAKSPPPTSPPASTQSARQSSCNRPCASTQELAWIFNCVARMGWVERMTQFKDKAGKDAQRSSVGLFDYPVLQAADILLYKATHVPVGEDQKQHLSFRATSRRSSTTTITR